MKLERRRMLDSRTVPVSYQGNIEFNMQSVINYWQNMQHRNYGLMVLVEDAFGNPLPPTMYIKQMNCSGKNYFSFKIKGNSMKSFKIPNCRFQTWPTCMAKKC